jgi:hypothetical protein
VKLLNQRAASSFVANSVSGHLTMALADAY